MSERATSPVYVLCVKNQGFKASLELRKIYRTLPDDRGTSHGLIRVVDESGEDYLYPADMFVPVDVPAEAVASL
jgi:hypothetical protein